jgi:hypothetical protein
MKTASSKPTLENFPVLARFNQIMDMQVGHAEAVTRCEQMATASTVQRTYWLAFALELEKERK